MFTRTEFDAFIKGLKYPPNDFQLKVLESAAFGSGNLVVSALAGSGKTSLLVMLANLFKAMNVSNVGYLAFNVSIKEELNSRLPSPYKATNSHSLGNNCLKAVNPKTRMSYQKWSDIAKNIMSNKLFVPSHLQYAAGRAFQALCSKVMLNMVDPEDVEAIAEIAERYGMDTVTPPMMGAVANAIQEAKKIWERTGEINFDEMLYWPVMLNLEPPKHDFFLVDEAQDLSKLQQELAFRSVKASGRSIWVGDKFQAIYAFSGADAASFENITVRTNATVLPLNVCYRCPSSHLDIARKLVPAIEARPNAPEGKIEYIKDAQVAQLAQPGSLVMCRLTAPLVSTYFKLIQNRVKSKVMGKDIGEQLISVMEKVAKYEGFHYDRSIEFLERYRQTQTLMLMQRENNEQAVENLNDQIETLIVCITNFDSAKNLDMLKAVLKDLFGDQDKSKWREMVTLCTVHRAKGLEAETTFILKPEKMPLVWKDQKHEDYQQELNILYVALTRSLDKMYICGELPAPVAKSAKDVVAVETKQDATEDEKKFAPLPLQPALLPLPEPTRANNAQVEAEPVRAEIAQPEPVGYDKRIEAFLPPKPVEIKPIEAPAPKTHTFPSNRERAAYSKGVMDALEQLSTGEIMQMKSVLEAILKERSRANEADWKELVS